MESGATDRHRSTGPNKRPRMPPLMIIAVLVATALLATTSGVAHAQVDERPDRGAASTGQAVETLRLACSPDIVDGQRGVACRWSDATNSDTRGYRLYRSTDGSGRELVATVGVGSRLGYFDREVSAPSTLVYAVVAVDRNGRTIGQSAPAQVDYGPERDMLRLACARDLIGGHRGVLCRWSATSQPTARGYVLYRIVDGDAREAIARVGLDGRLAHFDTDVVPGSLFTYGVTAVDGDGTVLAVGGPRHVRWPAAN